MPLEIPDNCNLIINNSPINSTTVGELADATSLKPSINVCSYLEIGLYLSWNGLDIGNLLSAWNF